ncbi:MAG TPA: YihY/virulence factor BrkB family protein [Deltaproteobacteria bacterium]|nr:YihY/virulence factor BrkB family protein [Deltaproteobacteria bacterium]
MLEKISTFFRVTLWKEPPESQGRIRTYGQTFLRALCFLFYRFWIDHCLMRASALAYMTILALVPLFGLMFSILKGLGVQRRLEPFILSKITVISPEAINRLVEYIDKVSVKSLGVFGTFWLLVIAITVFRNIEGALNRIWRVSKGRTLQRQISNYLSLLLILPISIFLVLSINTTMESNFLLKHFFKIALFSKAYYTLLKLSPYVVLAMVLTFVYLLMPNTRVRAKSAIVGGIIAGTMWQLAQLAYLRFQIGVTQYNAIYGAVYHIPMLLVWIYLSWAIILLGAEIVYLLENWDSRSYVFGTQESSPALKKVWVLTLLQIIGKTFIEGKKPLKLSQLARISGLNMEKVKTYLKEISSLEILEFNENEDSIVLPRVALENVRVDAVLREIEGWGGIKRFAENPGYAGSQYARTLVEKFEKGGEEAVGELTWKDLALAPENTKF